MLSLHIFQLSSIPLLEKLYIVHFLIKSTGITVLVYIVQLVKCTVHGAVTIVLKNMSQDSSPWRVELMDNFPSLYNTEVQKDSSSDTSGERETDILGPNSDDLLAPLLS